MGVIKALDEGILLFDGGMGSMLQKYGMAPGIVPESLNLTDRDLILKIQREYVAAGADIITTNTFQASPLKLPAEYPVSRTVKAGVEIAKAAGAKYVALDVGPLGQMLAPLGSFSFDQTYAIFAEQMTAGEKAGADLILLETFSDIHEAKIAVLAAKENTNLPVFCTMTFQQDGRTFMGCDPMTMVVTLCDMGIDAIGVNCSLGPGELMPIVEEILKYSPLPVVVQANAGLPEMRGGETVYTLPDQEFSQEIRRMLEKGVQVIGGCCGTTPDTIALLHELRKGRRPVHRDFQRITAISSGVRTAVFDGNATVIGERINPTGKPRLKEALRKDEIGYIVSEALAQTEAGSDVLDINVGLPEIDEAEVIRRVVQEVQAVTPLPLQVDSSDPTAIEAGVRIYNGKPLINSVNGKAESMAALFPVAKKYGAALLCLTLDERGIPKNAEERLEIARKILHAAEAYGIRRENLLFDCLTLTASAQQDQAMETLEAVHKVKNELGLQTVLGVSNVSFGLPNRPLLNATFLAAAFGAGLSAAIINPLSKENMDVVNAWKVFCDQDAGGTSFVQRYNNSGAVREEPTASETDLITVILQGRREEAPRLVKVMLAEGVAPLAIVNEHFTVALDTIGDKFARHELFLPQLLQSAETVKGGFAVIKAHMAALGNGTPDKGKIIIATVEGDIHDIGKNIVGMLLENYGYEVMDLGKDVPAEMIIEKAKAHDVKLIGLSALMTTTVNNMKETIRKLRESGVNASVMVGGAVLNPEYSDYVGADYYAGDALESVKIAEKVFSEANV